MTVQDVTILSKQTKRPARLTGASVLAWTEKYGLGMPTKRAAILGTLIRGLYVHRATKALSRPRKAGCS